MSDYVTDWPPMVAAMRRQTDRKIAMAGGRKTGTLSSDDEGEMLRQMLLGSDVDVHALCLVVKALKHYLAVGAEAGADVDSVLNGMLTDAFMLGFWTREAMP